MNTHELAERIEYVQSHVTMHMVGHGGEPTPLLSWAALHATAWADVPDLSPLDRVTGWTSPVLSSADPDGPIVVRFCPDIIVTTTAQLPLSPEPGGHRPWMDVPPSGIGSIAYVDNYVRFMEHILDMEIVYWDRHPDPVLRRQRAEDDLYEAHPAALQLVSLVQSAALWAVTG